MGVKPLEWSVARETMGETLPGVPGRVGAGERKVWPSAEAVAGVEGTDRLRARCDLTR